MQCKLPVAPDLASRESPFNVTTLVFISTHTPLPSLHPAGPAADGYALPGAGCVHSAAQGGGSAHQGLSLIHI